METTPLPITTAPDPGGIASAARRRAAGAPPSPAMTRDLIGVPEDSRRAASHPRSGLASIPMLAWMDLEMTGLDPAATSSWRSRP